MPPDVDELTAVFERGRRYKDVPREPWPEMGYLVAAWNGLDPPYGASLSVWPGGYSANRPFPNCVDLELNQATPGNADLMSVAALKPALLSVATAWKADRGNVVCWSYWRRLFGDRHYPLFRSGWMTYLAPQYASRITPPPAAIVEPVPNGGILLLATKERFSMDNPAHLAVADAIQATLEPLQEIVRPDALPSLGRVKVKAARGTPAGRGGRRSVLNLRANYGCSLAGRISENSKKGPLLPVAPGGAAGSGAAKFIRSFSMAWRSAAAGSGEQVRPHRLSRRSLQSRRNQQ